MAWNMHFIDLYKHPENHKNDIISFDDDLVVIQDKFPKAKMHYLVLPRIDLDKVTDLKKEHLPLLSKMKAKADSLVDESRKSGKIEKEIDVKIGFHSIPSMKHLHMHVISMDFDSPCLKRNVHWNSFTTDFFLTYDYVVEQLEKKGFIEVDKAKMEALQKQKMVCFVCHQPIKNIPELKRHIASGCLKHAKPQKRKLESDSNETTSKKQCTEKDENQ